MTRSDIYQKLASEVIEADDRYGPFASSHEGLGVLTEEYHELVEAIRSNKSESIREEALQVAAVAVRLAMAMDEPATLGRSGCPR